MSDYILTRKQVAERLSIHIRTLFRLEAKGLFPKSIRITDGRIGFRSSDVDAYIDARSRGENWEEPKSLLCD
jgi:predicted DNA-binding transcriptional regulator AlpA